MRTKVTKKLVIAVLIIAFTLGAAFLLTACTEGLPDNSNGVAVTLKIVSLSGTELFSESLETKQQTLFQLLGECDKLEISATYSFAGAYLKSIAIGEVVDGEWGPSFVKASEIAEGGNYANGDLVYIAVFHNVDKLEYKDLSGFISDLTLNGKTYFASGVGVSFLPLYDGATYVLKLVSA